ncbi:hypothetical protein QAD02_013131 [Eretmocerus hayati]|uniref:Uncharacterized protein n=1 Tax=Eretmocerus hayati TaxID=131215 RepID=A0ACC2P482_9HYME|nr:hypothetical protein QAD02_013131 [Eretmocerus hayati]
MARFSSFKLGYGPPIERGDRTSDSVGRRRRREFSELGVKQRQRREYQLAEEWMNDAESFLVDEAAVSHQTPESSQVCPRSRRNRVPKASESHDDQETPLDHFDLSDFAVPDIQLTSDDEFFHEYQVDEGLILEEIDPYDDDDDTNEYDTEVSDEERESVSGYQCDELPELFRSMRLDGRDKAYTGGDVLSIMDKISDEIEGFLPHWCLKNNISHNALHSLLQSPSKHAGMDLPASPRTILKTPRETKPITEIGGGHYCHFGLRDV